MSQMRIYSTANKDHGSIRDNVDVLHPRMFFLLPLDCMADGRQKHVIARADTDLVAE